MDSETHGSGVGVSRGAELSWGLALGVAYVLSRVPFLHLGYGLDDDAWFVARAADTLATTGHYVASRLPGYPTVEVLYGGLFRVVGTSDVVGNLAAAAAGLAAAVGVWLLLEGVLGWRLRLLAAAAVAFHPALFVASVTTLDPVWGVAFLVLAAAAVARDRPLLAGVLLGLAAGCRLTHVLALLPLVIFARGRGLGRPAVVRLTAAVAVVGGGLYLLPAREYGIGFLTFVPALHRDYLTGGYKVYHEIVGLPLAVAVVLVVAAVLASSRSRNRLPAAGRDPLVQLGAVAMVVLSTPFLLLPTDPQYLLPWVPFAVVMAAGLLREGVVARAWLAGLLVAAVVPSAVGLGELDLDAWRTRQALVPVLIARGHVVEHHADRRSQIEHAAAAARFTYPRGAGVIVGRPFMATQAALGVAERNLDDYVLRLQERDVLLFRLIPPWLLDEVAGRVVLYAAGEHLPYLTRRIFGYELAELGARPVRLWPEKEPRRELEPAQEGTAPTQGFPSTSAVTSSHPG